jgi:hypothetical protein
MTPLIAQQSPRLACIGRANAKTWVGSSHPTIAEMTAAGTLGIVSGVFGVGSGRVTWLP